MILFINPCSPAPGFVSERKGGRSANQRERIAALVPRQAEGDGASHNNIIIPVGCITAKRGEKEADVLNIKSFKVRTGTVD